MALVNVRLRCGIYLLLVSATLALVPWPAKAYQIDYVSQQIETTCAPKLNYFVFRAYTQVGIGEHKEALSGQAVQTVLESLADWVAQPVKCTLRFPGHPAHTIDIVGTDYSGSSARTCSNDGQPPSLKIMLDGRLIFTDIAVFSFCSASQTTINFNALVLTYCALPDIAYFPNGGGDDDYRAEGFNSTNTPDIASTRADCRAMNIGQIDLKPGGAQPFASQQNLVQKP